MKELILIIVAAFLPSFQAINTDIQLYTYWGKGDIQNIIIQEGFIDYEGETIIKKDVSITTVEITVLEETDSTYTIEWNYMEMTSDRYNVEVEEEDAIDKRIDEMFSHLKLQYQTDEFGEILSILNLDELLETMGDSIDVLAKEEMGESPEEAEMFSSMMKAMLNTEPMREEMLRDIYNYHYYLGDVFVSDTIINYEEEMDNKMGGDNIPVNGVVTIETDLNAKTIKINDKKEMDDLKTTKAMNEAAKKIKGLNEKQLIKNEQFKIEDIENYTYDYEYGRLKYYERNRIIKTDNKRKEQFIIIRETN